MYNKELKQSFIKWYTDKEAVIKLCKGAFHSFQPYEVKWGSDLCTRSVEELQEATDSTLGLRTKGRWAKISILKEYSRWCVSQGVENANLNMIAVTNDSVVQMRTHTVSRPKDLQRYLDAICLPTQDLATDNIYRCYYWLAFMGMEEEHILEAKCSDVDLDNMVVKYPQKNTYLEIYPEAKEAFRNCATLTEFTYVNPRYEARSSKRRASGDTLIRGIKSMPTIQTLRVELSRRTARKQDFTDRKLSYGRVKLSGDFYRMYDKELDGIEPDFGPVAERDMMGKEYSLTGRNTIETVKRHIVVKYESDYDKWKLAWYVGV